MAEWAGLPYDLPALKWAIRNSEFNKLKNLEEKKGLKLFDLMYAERDDGFRLMRAGKVGSYKSCFVTPESRKKFNEQAFDVLYGFDYVKNENWK